MDLYIGATVESADGQDVGTVERIIVDLATNEVTYYIMHRLVGRHRDVMVPAAYADERVRSLSLRILAQELDKLPEYLQARYGLSPSPFEAITGEGRRGPEQGLGAAPQLQEGQIAELSRNEPVDCVDGEVGVLEGVVVDELTDEVTDLIVRVKSEQNSARIPAAWASRLGPARIQLQCSTSEVESLAR